MLLDDANVREIARSAPSTKDRPTIVRSTDRFGTEGERFETHYHTVSLAC